LKASTSVIHVNTLITTHLYKFLDVIPEICTSEIEITNTFTQYT